MPTPEATHLTPKARRTRQRLIDAGRSLVGHHGVDLINVARLCEEAGVGRTSFYTYFVSAEAVLNEVAEAAATGIRDAFDEGHSRTPRGAARLRECLGMLFGLASDKRELALLLTSLAGEMGPVRDILFAEVRAEIEAIPGLDRRDHDALTHLVAQGAITTMRELARHRMTAATAARIASALIRACQTG